MSKLPELQACKGFQESLWLAFGHNISKLPELQAGKGFQGSLWHAYLGILYPNCLNSYKGFQECLWHAFRHISKLPKLPFESIPICLIST